MVIYKSKQKKYEGDLEIKLCGQRLVTAVFTGNDTFLTENITQDRKRLITQSTHIIF